MDTTQPAGARSSPDWSAPKSASSSFEHHSEGKSERPPNVVIELLVRIAGDSNSHIQMQPSGLNKYLTVQRPVTQELARKHILGEICLGASLVRVDGATHANCWDADDELGWEVLLAAADALYLSGAIPVLERSPSEDHFGGGHLWLFYDKAVDPGSAKATAVKHAPELAKIKETWPGGGKGSVRLPGGRYRRGKVDEWPKVSHVAGPEVSGLEALRLISRSLTKASWVTEPAQLVHQDREGQAREVATISPRPKGFPASWQGHEIPPPGAPHVEPIALQDPRWQAEYGDRSSTLWFCFTATQLAEWYGQHIRLQDILRVEDNGYGRADWRDERTPSVKLYPDGTWTDYGAGGHRPNGKRDSGDALELLCRAKGADKSEAMKYIAKQMLIVARRELKQAGRERRNPVRWVFEITSSAGWEHYDSIRYKAGPRPKAHVPAPDTPRGAANAAARPTEASRKSQQSFTTVRA
jgi:hypothetical protein